MEDVETKRVLRFSEDFDISLFDLEELQSTAEKHWCEVSSFGSKWRPSGAVPNKHCHRRCSPGKVSLGLYQNACLQQSLLQEKQDKTHLFL